MDYSKFYTPPQIATLLVKELNGLQPEEIIDICCGSCNLLHAAGKRWEKAKLTGIDIVKHSSVGVCIEQMDGRKFAIQQPHSYPLVLANPPFVRVEQKNEFPELYQGAFSQYNTSRLEIEMLLANLTLLRDNGILLIILPSTFVEASRNRTIRKTLGQNYHIKNIIKLPDDTFGATYINSYALIIKNCTNHNRITKFYSIKHNDLQYSVSPKIIIPQENIRNGDWCIYSHHISGKKLDIRRGNISSQSFGLSGTPVLHTARKSAEWIPSIRFTKEETALPVYADPGDIIVSRIGKSAGQWCQYMGESAPISDCLYRIKDPNNTIMMTIKGKKYSHPQKGVATRYITIEDFTDWIYSIEAENNSISASIDNT